VELKPQEVSFEHRVRKAGEVPASFSRVELEAARLHKRAAGRAKLWRWVFVILGAASVAFMTQRAGVELPLALCPFLGVLPVLWVGGWVFGYGVHTIRRAREGVIEIGSTKWQQELEGTLVLERVTLSLTREAMVLKRDEIVSSVDWKQVRFNRFGHQELAIVWNEGAMLTVPRTAFTSDEAFDDFCLTLQGFIWAAEPGWT
jgi:hypothetical protein